LDSEGAKKCSLLTEEKLYEVGGKVECTLQKALSSYSMLKVIVAIGM